MPKKSNTNDSILWFAISITIHIPPIQHISDPCLPPPAPGLPAAGAFHVLAFPVMAGLWHWWNHMKNDSFIASTENFRKILTESSSYDTFWHVRKLKQQYDHTWFTHHRKSCPVWDVFLFMVLFMVESILIQLDPSRMIEIDHGRCDRSSVGGPLFDRSKWMVYWNRKIPLINGW